MSCLRKKTPRRSSVQVVVVKRSDLEFFISLTLLLGLVFQVRCNCVECVSSSDVDSLRHSRSRLNIYRALSSPSLIALSSEDPFLTAFRLSWELQELSKVRSGGQ